MGGSNETLLGNLRCHISGGEAHVHDDKASLKFRMDQKDFRNEVDECMEALEKVDGVVKIEGNTSTTLCLVKDGKTLSMFLTDGQSIKTKLKSFIRGC